MSTPIYKVIYIALLLLAVMPASVIYAQDNPAPQIETQQPVLEESIKIKVVNAITKAQDLHTYRCKKMGFQVVAYLIIFALILWRVKKKIWKDVS